MKKARRQLEFFRINFSYDFQTRSKVQCFQSESICHQTFEEHTEGRRPTKRRMKSKGKSSSEVMSKKKWCESSLKESRLWFSACCSGIITQANLTKREVMV